jgi:hypothetical protein
MAILNPAAVRIIVRDDNRALRHHRGKYLLRTLAKGLYLFRCINAGKTNARQTVFYLCYFRFKNQSNAILFIIIPI